MSFRASPELPTKVIQYLKFWYNIYSVCVKQCNKLKFEILYQKYLPLQSYSYIRDNKLYRTKKLQISELNTETNCTSSVGLHETLVTVWMHQSLPAPPCIVGAKNLSYYKYLILKKVFKMRHPIIGCTLGCSVPYDD